MCKRIVLTSRTLEQLDGLEEAGRLKVVDMLLDYSFGREIDMTGINMEGMMAYMEIRKDSEEYAKLCEKRAEAGRKGMASRFGNNNNKNNNDNKNNKDNKDNKNNKNNKEETTEATPINPCGHERVACENYSTSNILDNNNIILSAKADSSISAEPKVDPHPSPSEKRPRTKIDFAAIKAYWNDQLEKTGSKMRRLTLMSEQRKSTVRARVKDVGGDVSKIYQAIDIAMGSSFMNGQNDRHWMGNYDWIMSPKNFLKVLEGNYTDNTPAPPQETKEQKIQRLVKEAQNDKDRNRRGWIAPQHTDEEYLRLNRRPEGYMPDWQRDAKLVSDDMWPDQGIL